jgi:hypothetical protein
MVVIRPDVVVEIREMENSAENDSNGKSEEFILI